MTGHPSAPPRPVQRVLPPWSRVLAVVAHPDDESFGLGAVLAGFAAGGSEVSVLCMTEGEASTLTGTGPGLRAVRGAELRTAADRLGVAACELLDLGDGVLAGLPHSVLDAHVVTAIGRSRPDGLITFDTSGVTGHADHAAAAAAALRAAAVCDLPVLGWTLPAELAEQLNSERGTAFSGRPAERIDVELDVDRARQLAAADAHASQAVAGSVLWRRLELLGGREHLSWLDLADIDDPTLPGIGAASVPGPADKENSPWQPRR